MRRENLSSIDLNLLVVLDALLTHQGVTEAGRHLGLSQPAVSHALKRLRDLLGDELLVRVGRKMVPTPRAEGLRERLEQILDGVRELLHSEPIFDPAATSREFVLACPDLLAPFLPDVLEAMAADAPAARLRVHRPLGKGLVDALAHGEVDLSLGAAFDSREALVVKSLGSVGWAVMMRTEHPLASEVMTPERWVDYPHVTVVSGTSSPNRVAGWLAKAGLERTVGVTVPTFLLAPRVVARTNHLFTGPRELLAETARTLGLVLREPPLPLPEVAAVMQWHPRARNDPGHAWFRNVVATVTARVLRGVVT